MPSASPSDAQLRAYRLAAPPRPPSPGVIGGSAGVLAALRTARRVANSSATVLIQGESGTGKELLARVVHDESGRAPFVAVNCAAIPENLLESELFGHEKGAFTGALGRRVGRFERANGGTLFLDEVGDMSPSMQAKILRALQEHEVERVGGDRPIAVDVRVLAATNRDLAAEVAAGRFREDLFYRLAVVVLHLPPLRERGGDVELLARHFVAHFARRHGLQVDEVAPEAMALLRAYRWPGNVRQLGNVIEGALLVADGSVLLPEHLPPDVRAAAADGPEPVPAQGDHLLPLREMERIHINRALARTRGNLVQAAELLGIHRNTLRDKLRRMG
ncbi:MAG TPA: sigma 54-interacting transcriptional regulator [Longimicrobium sp.]|jgi:DNA-binding NtrC family response regulator